eukprot:scaffold6067_cov112-Isochrysis_galbana.AAC.5
MAASMQGGEGRPCALLSPRREELRREVAALASKVEDRGLNEWLCVVCDTDVDLRASALGGEP